VPRVDFGQHGPDTLSEDGKSCLQARRLEAVHLCAVCFVTQGEMLYPPAALTARLSAPSRKFEGNHALSWDVIALADCSAVLGSDMLDPMVFLPRIGAAVQDACGPRTAPGSAAEGFFGMVVAVTCAFRRAMSSKWLGSPILSQTKRETRRNATELY